MCCGSEGTYVEHAGTRAELDEAATAEGTAEVIELLIDIGKRLGRVVRHREEVIM